MLAELLVALMSPPRPMPAGYAERMDALLRLLRHEPALAVGAIQAVAALVVGLGVEVPAELVATILAVLAAAGAAVTRTAVTPMRRPGL